VGGSGYLPTMPLNHSFSSLFSALRHCLYTSFLTFI
jgi:hypothetical protein